MSCWVISLGWCARTLFHVAWRESVCPEDEVNCWLGFVCQKGCGVPPCFFLCVGGGCMGGTQLEVLMGSVVVHAYY